MKIAQISPPWLRTPPKKYGGTEGVVSFLTEELVAQGHEVTLFATGDSLTSAHLWSCYDHPRLKYNWRDELFYVQRAAEFIAQGQFDIIHNHTYVVGPALFKKLTIPSVSTYHIEYYPLALSQQQSRIPYIAISNSQRKQLPDLHWIGTVYNAIDSKRFDFQAQKDNYLFWIGRINQNKGLHFAIHVAQQLDCHLKIAGPIEDEQYFKQNIAPHLNDRRIEYVGEVGFEKKVALYRHAMALLFPLTWDEAFGLVSIEAMACGTPVIAFSRGALPEIVIDEQTGYIVDDVEQMIEAVKKLGAISPFACREHVERHFNVKLMAEKYVTLYQHIIETHQYENRQGMII